MKLSNAIFVLTAALGALVLWLFGASTEWISSGVMVGLVGLGLGLIAVAWIVRERVRNRQYRRLREMRDSALW